ncbi:uncharacterized protein LOC112506029 [Cynara cardunculus var. scolymus]|uniref:uncharacterized protein LOC112506029 n=1 Tax=Cynara cardunculus var. scolymus TaxID=59895 RepID=UPI000D62DC7F|nr:uncharacterized protein LOC112506029 [Cynara cardunculus var. scolymus]
MEIKDLGGKYDKNRRTIGNFGAQTQTVNQRDKAKCNRCKYPHWGNCITCQRCHLGGHTTKDCRKQLCFDCGSPDHMRNVCPKRKQGPNAGQARTISQGNLESQTRGRAFEIGAKEARDDPNVVSGTFLLNNEFASVLFDSGADRSFVSLDFKQKINLKSQRLKEAYVVEFANGQEFRARNIIKDCTLSLANKDFSINLIPIGLGSFDIVVGMDCLSKNRAEIVCSEKVIWIPQEGNDPIEIQGDTLD